MILSGTGGGGVGGGATRTVCNVLHGWSREQNDEQQKNVPSPKKNNAAAGYKGPVKIELLKGTGLLERGNRIRTFSFLSESLCAREFL